MSNHENASTTAVGWGAALALLLAIVLGLVMDNLVVGIVIGLALSTALGAVQSRRTTSTDRPDR